MSPTTASGRFETHFLRGPRRRKALRGARSLGHGTLSPRDDARRQIIGDLECNRTKDHAKYIKATVFVRPQRVFAANSRGRLIRSLGVPLDSHRGPDASRSAWEVGIKEEGREPHARSREFFQATYIASGRTKTMTDSYNRTFTARGTGLFL